MRIRTVRDEQGQAVPLAAALVALVAMLAVGMGVMARDVADAGRARAAADAAALAGVTGDRSAAVALATANGATLVAWARDGPDVVVTVRVGSATATARATGGDVAN